MCSTICAHKLAPFVHKIAPIVASDKEDTYIISHSCITSYIIILHTHVPFHVLCNKILIQFHIHISSYSLWFVTYLACINFPFLSCFSYIKPKCIDTLGRRIDTPILFWSGVSIPLSRCIDTPTLVAKKVSVLS